MEIEGSIHILKLDRDGDPAPWTYDVTFNPYSGDRPSRPRKCNGLEELERYLADIGILREYLRPALDEIRAQGRAELPRVRLTEDRMRELGLL